MLGNFIVALGLVALFLTPASTRPWPRPLPPLPPRLSGPVRDAESN